MINTDGTQIIKKYKTHLRSSVPKTRLRKYKTIYEKKWLPVAKMAQRKRRLACYTRFVPVTIYICRSRGSTNRVFVSHFAPSRHFFSHAINHQAEPSPSEPHLSASVCIGVKKNTSASHQSPSVLICGKKTHLRPSECICVNKEIRMTGFLSAGLLCPCRW